MKYIKVKEFHSKLITFIDHMYELFLLQPLLKRTVFSTFLFLTGNLLLFLMQLLQFYTFIDVVTQNKPDFNTKLFDDKYETLFMKNLELQFNYVLFL